eukprot:365392-Chlamydomonas_euryale.AAC.8
MGSAVDLGLLNGALCNDCDLAAEDVQVIASGKASVKGVKSAECLPVRMRLYDVRVSTHGARVCPHPSDARVFVPVAHACVFITAVHACVFVPVVHACVFITAVHA